MKLKCLALISSLLFCGCATVKISDDPWCADAGKFGAKCFNTITDTEFSLNKYEWDKLRVGQICTATTKPGEGYLHIRVPLEKLCANSNLCTVEQKKALKAVSEKADKAIDESGDSPAFDTGTKTN